MLRSMTSPHDPHRKPMTSPHDPPHRKLASDFAKAFDRTLRLALDHLHGDGDWDEANAKKHLALFWGPADETGMSRCFLFWDELPLGELVPELERQMDFLVARVKLKPATGRHISYPSSTHRVPIK